MKSNLLGALRGALLIYIIGMVALLCYIERETLPPSNPPSPAKSSQPSEEQWTSLGTFLLSAYCPCQECCSHFAINRPKDNNGNTIVYTSIGAIAKAKHTIAVDPTVIPYGTKIKINEHIYTAEDCGGAIKGNRIDVYFDTHEEALNFGLQNTEIFIKREDINQ